MASMTNRFKKSNFLFCIILYFLFVGPNFKLVDLFWLSNFIIFICGILYILFNRIRVNNSIKVHCMIFLVFLVSSFLSLIISKSDSIDYLVGILKLGLLLFDSYFFAFLAVRHFEVREQQLLRIIINLILSVAIISICIFFNVDVQLWMVDNTNIEIAKSAHYMSYRLVDLSIGGGTALSLTFLLGMICILELIKRGFYDLIFLILIPLFIVIIFLSARTGFGYLVFVFMYYFTALKTFIKVQIRKVLILSFASLFLLLYIIQVSENFDFNFFLSNIDGLLEVFVSESYSPGSGTTSSILIHEHLKLDHNLIELLIGKNNIEIDSDIGYIKLMYAGGLLSVMNFLFFWFYLFISSVKFNIKSNLIWPVFFLFSAFVFLTNLKELLFFNARGVFFMVLFLYFYSGLSRGVLTPKFQTHTVQK